MPLPLRSQLLVIVCGVLAAALPAQAGQGESVRKPTFVRVVDARDQPLAGATVTLAGGQPHLGMEVASVDVQVVASDARGRAQAKLLPGLCYVVWAVGPADAQGAGVRSEVQGFFGAGALVELRCESRYAALRVAVTGTDAWRAQGPLRFYAITSTPGTEVELVADADGRLPLPPWPQVALEVRTKDGQPLWSAAAAADELAIPPPRSIAVRVVDDNGAPIAGALVQHRVGRLQTWRADGIGGVSSSRFRTLAVTPANGQAVVDVPYAADPLQDQGHGDLLLFAAVPGRPAVAGGVFGRALYQDDRKVAAWKGSELVFTCRATEALAGQCGAVPAGAVAHLAAVCKLFSDDNSYTHDARSFVATIGADGRFAFADLPLEVHSCRLTLLLPDGSSQRLPLFSAMQGRTLPPEVANTPRGRAAAIGYADLQVRVTDPDGGPARGVVAFLAPADTRGVLFRDSVVRVPLDAAGSTTLRLAPGRWLLLAFTGLGYLATSLEVEAGERALTFAMQPMATMRVVLRDAEGKPMAGARVQVRGSSTRGTADPLQSALQSLRMQARTAFASLQTDRDGALVIPFLPVQGSSNRLALAWDGGSTPDFVLEANDTPLELRPK